MYKQYKSLLSIFSVVAVSCLSLPNAYASSNFTITPAAGHTFPSTISSGETVSAYYRVLNNTHSTRSGYQVNGLPSYVTQNTSGVGICSNPLILAANKSCTLRLDITQPIKSSFALCKGTSCTTAAVPLNVVSKSTTPPTNSPLRVAVGTYMNTAGGFAALAYTSTNSGITWNVNTNDLPLGPDAAPGANADAKLLDVACDKTTKLRCVAVGYYANNSGGHTPVTYTSINGGNSWSLSTALPSPSDIDLTSPDTQLTGVSCDSAALHCTAVGGYFTNLTSPFPSSLLPLVYTSTNGGNSWTLNATALTLPADATASPYTAQLSGVACNDGGLNCSAVGYYKANTAPAHGLAYTSTDGGSTWTLRTVPIPANSEIPADIRVLRVTCNSPAGLQCIAVGAYNASGGRIPVVYTSSNGGSTWTPNASDLALPNVPGTVDALLANVACDSNGLRCNAVGFYRSNGLFAAATYAPLSYTSTNSGTSWTLGSAFPTVNNSNQLGGVVCDKETGLQCSTVGLSIEMLVSENGLPIAYKSSNGGITWSTVSLALPANATTNASKPVGLYSVK